MYPLDLDVAYPRNHWFVAGHPHEFGREIVAKQIFDEPLVLFRTEAGEPVALSARCVHRHMPLDTAFREGDTISCPYHGYRYEKDGRCSQIPTGGVPPKSARLRRYPVVEHGPFVWIWMGAEENADPALLPRPAEMGLNDGATGWRHDISQTFPLQARATLLVDNLFDLSHIAFSHAKSLPIPKHELMIEPRLETVDGRLRVTRAASGPNAPDSFWKFIWPHVDGPVVRELITEMHNPGLINAAQWLFEMEPDGSKGAPLGYADFVHVLTPETAHSTHYIGIISRNFRQDDDAFSAMLVQNQDLVRSEDVFVLEAIERDVDRFGNSRREISTKADEGAIRIRNLLRQMIKAEQAAVPMAAQ